MLLLLRELGLVRGFVQVLAGAGAVVDPEYVGRVGDDLEVVGGFGDRLLRRPPDSEVLHVFLLNELPLEVAQLPHEAHVRADDVPLFLHKVEGLFQRPVVLLHQVGYHGGRGP